MSWNKGRHPALEGASYFRATNTTPGTGIAMGIQTGFSATANALFVMRSSGTKTVIPHYIRLINTAAGASTTASHVAIVTDTVSRYDTGGTDLLANIRNANTGTANTSAVDVLRYSCTAAAAGSGVRIVGRAALKTQAAACWVVGDELLMTFGDDAVGGAASGAAAQRLVVPFGTVALGGANHSMVVHMWNPGNATTAPSWEFELAWYEI